MRRALVILGLLACAYFEFTVYPGHTFLSGESQVFAPMLERLRFPGLLSRDLVATHPILRYTVYDEATLLLERAAHLDLGQALAAQQFAARFGQLLGVYLIASSAAVPAVASILIAAAAGVGIALPGVIAFTSHSEPVPYATALGFLVLSAGLAAREKVLLSGVFAGVALLYSVPLAVPFWLCLLAPPLLKRNLRPALRTLFTIFAVFALLLANLAQLQPGAPVPNSLVSRISPAWLEQLQTRTPAALVWTWASQEIWLYSAIVIAGLCAMFRLRFHFSRMARWLLLTLFTTALLSVPFMWIVQLALPLSFWMRVDLTRILLLAVLMCFTLSGIAAFDAWKRHLWQEMAAWSMAVIALLLTPFLIPPQAGDDSSAAFFSVSSVTGLSRWARDNTWGGSMFLFAGAGRHADAGRFRALSLRSVYVDWQGGELTRHFEDFAVEWAKRWQRANAGTSVAAQIRGLLPESIDYYVIAQGESFAGVAPVYSNRELAVYDARDLKSARGWIKRSN